MHTRAVAEADGGYDDGWRPCHLDCPACWRAGRVDYRVWVSDCGGYEDCQCRCAACGHTWWVDGADA